MTVSLPGPYHIDPFLWKFILSLTGKYLPGSGRWKKQMLQPAQSIEQVIQYMPLHSLLSTLLLPQVSIINDINEMNQYFAYYFIQ